MSVLKKTVSGILLFLMIMLPGCSGDETPGPEKKNAVTPIDVAGIQSLINNQDCPLMLVAMAAWCAPCREELPILQKMHEKYKGDGLRIVGISLDIGGSSAMQPLVDQMGLEFPVYWGGEKVTAEYGISGIPLTLFVGNGKLIETITGQRSEAFIEKKIISLLEKCKNRNTVKR